MKQYCNTIIKLIDLQLAGKNTTVRIKLENFEHPRIYWEICSYYKDILTAKGIAFVAKLALDRYAQLELKSSLDGKAYLQKLSNSEFVDFENRMTYWRNASSGTGAVVFLMGTEAVEDRGGLADFFTINPYSVNIFIKNDWSKWFEDIVIDQNENERQVINNFISSIFKFSPVDSFKLSTIIDELSLHSLSVNEVVDALCKRLWDDWRIPNIDVDRITPSTINQLSKGKLKIIELAIKFRDRQAWKDGLTENKLIKIQEQVNKWENKYPIDERFELMKKNFEDETCFKQALLDYIQGRKVEILRPLLCSLDFAFINEILNIKLSTTATSENKTNKVFGNPFMAFVKAVLLSLENYSSTNVKEIVIYIDSIKLANCTNEDDLVDNWSLVGRFAGGILEFIQQEEMLNGERQPIKLSFENPDYFTPSKALEMVTCGVLSKGPEAQKNNKIEFNIIVNGEEIPSYYRWEFNSNDGWVNSFYYINTKLQDYFGEKGKLVPYQIISNFSELIHSTNEQDFSQLVYKSNLKETKNILQELESKLNLSENSNVLDKVRVLAVRFQDFAEELIEFGFFNTMNSQYKNTSLSFVQAYCDLIKYSLNNQFSSQVKEVLYLLVNSFVLTEGTKYGFGQKGFVGAIIPPYHPSMLEKMQAQFQFLRQGLSEIYYSILNDGLIGGGAKQRLERLEQLSTITSGVDILISSATKQYLTPKNIFGYYGLYGSSSLNLRLISSNNVLNGEVIDDEDFSEKELVAKTPISNVIERSIWEYLVTFPSQMDGLKLLFINPNELQSVIAGIHSIVKRLKGKRRTVRINLQILMPYVQQGGRNYLIYWLDNFFTEEDNVHIQTYYKTYDENSPRVTELLSELMSTCDMAFVQNILEVKGVDFENTQTESEESLPVTETRFPMVFLPLPMFKTSVFRKTTLSQFRFDAAYAHSQLIHHLENPSAIKDNYRVIRELELGEKGTEILNSVHAKAKWVVCLDSGIDKELVKYDNNRIIGFSTGEGPFGELNVTVSAQDNLQKDVVKKLIKRLKIQFSKWDDNTISEAANHCLKTGSQLDGARVLKALNPNDRELHNFLAYILTAETLQIYKEDSRYLVRSLIHLDSYTHWFDKGGKRPDFLLLEILVDELENIELQGLTIHATLIECKMGLENVVYVDKAMEQLSQGFEALSKRWVSPSDAIDSRFWFAQLYRAIVFSVINRADYSEDYHKFTNALQQIIEGKFKIDWSTLLYTFWLDDNSEELEEKVCESLNCGAHFKHVSFGQLYIQKMLLPPEQRNREFEFNLQDDTINQETETSPEITNSCSQDSIPIEITDSQNYIPIDNVACGDESKIERTTTISIPVDAVKKDIVTDIRTESQPLEQVRILIGEDIRTNEKVYWEYGNPQLPNRHILISGNSGTGKTYLMQSLLLELSKCGISSLVFDYTDGFTESKLEPEFKEYIGEKLVQFSVYNQPFPINPFRKYTIEVNGQILTQKDVDVAERIKSVLTKVYRFGDQQASAIYRATRNGLLRYQNKLNLELLRKELEAISGEISNSKTVISKLDPLVDREPFDANNVMDWSELRNNPGTVYVVQLSGFTREVQVAITEFILWDAWYYNVQKGDKGSPFPVVLDEAQNLDHGEKSPSGMILTEGRKFGWSGWFATQFMKDQLKKDEIQRLQQASQKLYFAPPESEIEDVASNIEADRNKAKDWYKRLSLLKKGECVVSGYGLRNGTLEKHPPRIVKVSSLSERTK